MNNPTMFSEVIILQSDQTLRRVRHELVSEESFPARGQPNFSQTLVNIALRLGSDGFASVPLKQISTTAQRILSSDFTALAF